jgi:putative ABC transport system permease protein
MFRNYLTIARRHLTRHKAYTFINIAGLAGGMACCFLILLFVRHELSYDTFHEKADRMYRIKYDINLGGNELQVVRTPPPVAPVLPGFFPEMEKVARLYLRNASVRAIRPGQPDAEQFEEANFAFADSTILDIFSFSFLAGNPQRALDAPFSVIITDEMARKYFGTEAALGQTLQLDGRHPLNVSGVIRKYPDNSHIRFNLLANYETMFATENEAARENLQQNWLITHSYTYVLLRPGHSAAAVNARFPEFLRKFGNPQLVEGQKFTLEPLLNIHLHSEAQDETSSGDITYIYVFTGIAIITLLIACINFINLSTAGSLRRAREVAMRKVLGAYRSQLIGQFLGESLLISLLAFILSIGLVVLLLPLLNDLTGRELALRDMVNAPVMLGFVGLFLLAGLLAGSYPAFFVSGFQPVVSLKGSGKQGKAGGTALRKVLVVVQFTVSIILMAGAVIAFQQLQYLRNRPLGFQKEHILTAALFSENLNNIFAAPDPAFRSKTNAFEDLIAQHPRIVASTLSSGLPGTGAVSRGIVPEGFSQTDNIFIPGMAVDYDFIATYGLEIIAGRDFSKEFGTDHLQAFIVNEQAVKRFNWGSPEEAVGKTIDREGKKGQVVGVVRDFHYQPLTATPIDAFVFDVNPTLFTNFSIKIQSDNVPETIRFLEEKWADFFPGKAFTYAFLDENLNQAYTTEQRLGRIIGYFAFLAIFISGLGLFGLASFTAAQRTQEIGIRKVLGASVPQIVQLFYRDFTRLVLIAFAIALPITWYLATKWLENFSYGIKVSIGTLILSGVAALLIALLTVSYQSIKAALADPVRSLRHE